MAVTVSPEEGARLGAVMAIILQHRPGWGFSVGFHSGGFHAVMSSPECQQVGKAGRLFAGRGETPSKALSEAFTASGPQPKGAAFLGAGALALSLSAELIGDAATHGVRPETVQ